MAHVIIIWGWVGSQGRNFLRTAILVTPKEQPNIPHASERITEVSPRARRYTSFMSKIAVPFR